MVNWIAVMLFVGVTVLAAGRLLMLFRETRQLPELLIAMLILGVGTLGVGGSFVIGATLPEGTLRTFLLFIPSIGVHVGMSALCMFTWLVYRKNSTVGRTAAGTLVCILAVLLAHALLRGSIDAVGTIPTRAVGIASSIIYVAVMAWSAIEALIYWRTMRHRLAIGLADAMVTNRFLLWGLATGASAQGIAIGAVAGLGFGLTGDAAAWISLCYAAHGSLSAICFWLAFKPPKAYTRWVTQRAPAT